MQFAATNRGGQSHLTGELFRERAKVNITFVHAQGAATSLNDVTAGRIPIMFEGLAGLAPGLQGGGEIIELIYGVFVESSGQFCGLMLEKAVHCLGILHYGCA
jgi:hypothetical protein